jgi:hypothetical protein
MAIKKIKPKSPDPYLGKTVGDNTLARIAHVNQLVDQINNNNSSTLPYKVYTAQILMGDGSATVFENTLGVTITWTATSGQISSGTVTGLIGQNNVYVQVSSATPSANNIYIVSGEFSPSPWVVRVKQNDNTGSPTNTQYVFVEIRVYN